MPPRNPPVDISVVVPCHGNLRHLPLQLEALLNQDAGTLRYEIVLVDNGAKRDLRSLSDVDAPMSVRVVNAFERTGTAYARNVGIANVRGGRLLFCDSDDVVGPTWVADGAAALERHPAFSGGAVPFTHAELDQQLSGIWRLIASRMPAYASESHDMPVGTYPILLGCSFGIRRELVNALGGFDEAYGSQAEDNDLAFRLQKHLGSLPRVANVAVAYRRRSHGDGSFRRSFRAGMNHARLCHQHDAWSLSPTYEGHWLLRPAKDLFRSCSTGQSRKEIFGTIVGVALGRARWR